MSSEPLSAALESPTAASGGANILAVFLVFLLIYCVFACILWLSWWWAPENFVCAPLEVDERILERDGRREVQIRGVFNKRSATAIEDIDWSTAGIVSRR